ncbi:MAG: hypothetical protein HKN11_16735 [Rhizobiales bacterium]|nr:hypothetical protein [Hyphomicrobiales bacterium]
MATTSKSTAPAPAPAADPGQSYFEWAPTLAGSVLAVAISLVLAQFGAGVGLSVGEPVLTDGSASWNVLVAGLWLVWVALASSAAGGYVAGRMRAKFPGFSAEEVEFRDGLHGLIVWALATILAALALGALTLVSTLGVVAAEAPASDERLMRLTANITTISSFSAAAGAALGAAAAWWAGTLGGQHRDNNIDVHALVPRMFRRT